ncbi:MAG: cupin domain-containing protein [Prevotellaceae bacterium]|jgi:quercetin dioxygenase-like cupin family protein|nr:cupin domain-containing protein [Prevotellaceae bacterium]
MALIDTTAKFIPAEMIEYSRHGIISRQIVRSSAGNVTLFSFGEGQALSEHSASFDGIIQILEGVANVIIDGKDNVLTAGEVIILPANVPHALRAIKRFKMILTTIKI